jgi:hypothetical protein
MIHSKLTGTEVRISPSSYGTAEDCWLKWYFNKVVGIATPTTPNQKLGTDVHSVLEDYLLVGTLPNLDTEEGRIADSGIHLIPDPGIYSIEKELSLTCGPINFKGIVDAWNTIEAPTGNEGWLTHVLDHKTTKSFDWALSSEQLMFAPQPLAYVEAMKRLNLIEPYPHYLVELVYYKTKGSRDAASVKALVSDDVVVENWHEMEVAAEKMAELSQVTDPLAVPYNTSACRKYGGCPFSDFCPRHPNNQRTQTLNQGTIMPTPQQLKLQAFIRGESQVRPPDAAPTNTPTDKQKEDTLAFFFKTQNTSKPVKLTDMALLTILSRFQLSQDHLPWLKEQIKAKAVGGVAPKTEAVEAKTPSPKKKKKKPVPKPVPQPCPQECSQNEGESPDAPFYVFVDCLPHGGADISLDNWAWAFEREVSENSERYTDDGKPVAVRHYNAIPYGVGKTAVLNLMTADILGGKKWGSIFVSSRHALASPIVSLLSNLPNAMVIRGVR